MDYPLQPLSVAIGAEATFVQTNVTEPDGVEAMTAHALEAFGQRDPLVEYKRRAFELFEELGDNIRRIAVRSLFRQSPAPLAPE